MSARRKSDVSWLANVVADTPEDLAYDHAMDISGSVYARMEELGITQQELADRIGMDAGQLSRVIRGNQNLTLKTIAKIEVALDFRLDSGFRYISNKVSGGTTFSVEVDEIRSAEPEYVRASLSVMKGGLAA